MMVELVMTGRKSAQQQIWEKIRARVGSACRQEPEAAPGFRESDLVHDSGVDQGVVRTYLSRLVKGGYLRFDGRLFALGRDVGVEAPNLNTDGSEDKSDRPYEAIWRVLRIMGDITLDGALDVCEIAGVPTGKTQVQRYLNALLSAGYLSRNADGVYRLQPGHWTGPQFPRLTRHEVLVLCDQNDDRVVWSRGDVAIPKVIELASENEQLRRLVAGWLDVVRFIPDEASVGELMLRSREVLV